MDFHRQQILQSGALPNPSHRIPYARSDTRTFSDGSHSLRRSINVAQNLSRLADLQIVPSEAHSISTNQTLSYHHQTIFSPTGPINEPGRMPAQHITTQGDILRAVDQLSHLTRPEQYPRRDSNHHRMDQNVARTMEEDDTDDDDGDEELDEDDSDQESTGAFSISNNPFSAQNQYDNIIPQSQQHIMTDNQQPIYRRPVPPMPQRTSSRMWLQNNNQFQQQERNPQLPYSHTEQFLQGQASQPRLNLGDNTPPVVDGQQPRPAFLSQPVYQLACAACIRPLCLRAMKAVMLSDHSKELYSTDMPPAGLQLVNDDRQVRHCVCRIRDSACLGCGQVAGYHVTQPCSDCLSDQNNGHFWMFYSSAVYHYKRNRIDGSTGDVMLWANVPPISYDQALSQQLRLEVPVLSIQTKPSRLFTGSSSQPTNEDRPMTACIEMDEWLNSPVTELVCR